MRTVVSGWTVHRPLAPAGVVVAALLSAPLAGWLIANAYWTSIALLGVAWLLPLALRWPVFIFGAYAFSLPFSYVAVIADSGGVSIAKVLGLATVAILLTVGVVERRFVKPPVAALWFIVLVVWSLLSISWSVAPGDSSARMPTILSILALYLVAVSFRV